MSLSKSKIKGNKSHKLVPVPNLRSGSFPKNARTRLEKPRNGSKISEPQLFKPRRVRRRRLRISSLRAHSLSHHNHHQKKISLQNTKILDIP